ncbi:MAG: chromosomal replication initiator protein DnaA [Rhodospirillaceae bacterium]|nr:chromosomal replication initiator protein DnaA [Rhodospirillaceae bacterium]
MPERVAPGRDGEFSRDQKGLKKSNDRHEDWAQPNNLDAKPNGIDDSVPARWARVRARLRQEFGDAAYRNWLKQLTFGRMDEDQVVILAPTPFMRDRVASQFEDRIRAAWEAEFGDGRAVRIEAARDARGPKSQGSGAQSDVADEGVPDDFVPDARTAPRMQLNGGGRDEIAGTLDARFTFENFVVGKPNELAFAAARRVAESETVPFNPLFLYGGVGLGKTHLMHAIAWHIRTMQPNRRVIYMSAEKFMYQFIRALRFKDTVAFKDLFRSVDVLMIDDVQFISGKESTQEEFFHTFNALVDQNHQVIISADKSPTDLEGLEERLRSRLGWGLVADIHPTTYELRLGILQSKAERMGGEIPPKVLEFLAHKITSNVRELEGALNRIVAHSQLIGRDISLENTQEVLRDLLRAHDRRVTVEEIQRQVANHFNLRLADMHSARRARAIARPRQVAMYLSKQLTSQSLPDIGRRFGGRDHTTVLHAVKKIDELRSLDKQFNEEVDLLRRMLET